MNNRGLVALAAGLLSGCGNPWVGSWLFSFDPEATVTGTCAPETDTTTITGQSYTWVDILEADGGSVVVFLEEPLQGTPDGDSLTATYAVTEADGYSASSDSYTLKGTLDGGVLTGNVEHYTTYTDLESNQTEDCKSAYKYTAWLSDTDRDDYANVD